MWVLMHTGLRNSLDASLPDCVCFERYHEVHGGAHTYTFRVCQYSSRHDYSHSPPSSGIYHKPVNLWRGEVASSRSIWEMFVSDGWTPVDTATPEGCTLAGMHFHACKYRDAISTMNSQNHWSGAYADAHMRSDLAGDFYLVSKYPYGISTRHPVTQMPRIPNGRRSRRSMFQTNSIPVHVQNTSQTDNYALGA
jgi:hypothetical protein